MNELINLQEYYDGLFREKVDYLSDHLIIIAFFRPSILSLESIIEELAK
jgi:hypothetical protein